MNCSECKFETSCCCTDAWIVNLTNEESKIHPHVVTSTGIIAMASGSDGYCYYRDSETHQCKIYENRPQVCRQFSCENKESDMKALLNRYKEIRKNIDSSLTGYLIAYVTNTNSPKAVSSIILKDIQTNKETQVIPIQVHGNTEEEIKTKMIDLINQSLKK